MRARQQMLRRAIPAVLACAGTLVACGAGQARIEHVFDTDWEDDGGRSISAVQSKLANQPLPKGADVAVGVTSKGLLGVELASGSKWSFVHPIDARPWIAGGVVVGSGGGKVFALDAGTGKLIWSRPSTGKVRGAGDDGRTTVVSMEPSASSSGMLVAVSRDGNVVRQLEANVALGTPAVVANLVFIPWQNQYVTVYDLSSGEEIARATLRHQTSHALVIGGSLYFGEVGATRFDDRIGSASRNQASKVSLPERELPGKPRWMRAGGFVGKPTSDAFDMISLYARPEPRDGTLGLDSDRYYGTYYRIAVGLQAGTGELAWARKLESDAIGGAAYDGGLALCQRSGEVKLLAAANGADAGTASLGASVRACVVQADALTRSASGKAASPLVDQLTEAIDVNETEMVMMHRFLLRELNGLESPKATERLIELAADIRTSPALLQEVRTGLAARRNGAEYMLAALAQRYDYLKGVLVAPPVGPLADALAAMGEKGAAPLLAAHLNDPADSSDDVKRAALALVKLATAAEMDDLKIFFALYRATAHEDELVAAVVAVAKAILRVGGKDGRALVESAAMDPMTVPSLRTPLSELVRAPAPPAPPAGG